MLGHQDTLFTGPLPHEEKQTGGFTGPTQFAPRIPGHQLYEDCFICGEVDFIFGSAICYFKNCELYALNRNMEINSYYTAPSTYENQQYGYVFESCNFTGNCPERTVMLSRPWRIYDWNKPESHDTCYYAEYKCFGDGYVPDKRPPYVHQLTDEEAAIYSKEKVLAL